MNTLKHTILYLQLLSFASPEHVTELRPLRDDFGEDWPQAVVAASRLMVAFQQASRDPEPERVAALARAALSADLSPEACRAFQDQMNVLAQLPGRAKPENRLHRKRGCRLCETPCRYGFFSLITEPNFENLQNLLETHPSQPVQTVWRFTLKHLAGGGQSYITADHLGNLSYCLISLATAKSRYPFPEAQMRKFQARNQAMIDNQEF